MAGLIFNYRVQLTVNNGDALKNPPGLTGRVLYSDLFGEAELIIMKHLQTRDYKDENVPASCSCRASHYKLTPLDTLFIIAYNYGVLNAFPHGIFSSYNLHGSVRG